MGGVFFQRFLQGRAQKTNSDDEVNIVGVISNALKEPLRKKTYKIPLNNKTAGIDNDVETAV